MKEGRTQELCEESGGPGLSFSIQLFPVPNKTYGFCGRGAPWKKAESRVNMAVGLGCHSLSHSSPVPKKPYGLSQRRASAP